MADRFHPNHHFAPKANWINDPNGLVYHDGNYEMYFQHNPEGLCWDNICWGHARSRDLVHWEERPVAMSPDEDGMMFSGCAILNDRGLLGLPRDAIVYFYTAAGGFTPESEGKDFTIRLAYSIDGGDTVVKSGKKVLESLAYENRDPKVFWHEESQAYIMVLFITQNDFGVFRSVDLEHFVLTQRFTLDGGFECPGLMCLPVDGTDETKWVFWAADNSYYVGSFDGYTFTQTQRRLCAYEDGRLALPYAAQSWSGIDCTMMISWLNGGSIGGVVTGCMTYPRELFLIKKPFRMDETADPAGEYRLAMRLPELIEKQFSRVGVIKCPGETLPVQDGSIRFRVNARHDFAFALTTTEGKRILEIVYQERRGALFYGQDIGLKILHLGTPEDLEIVYDRGILEITGNRGSTSVITDHTEVRGEIPAAVLIERGTDLTLETDVIPANGLNTQAPDAQAPDGQMTNNQISDAQTPDAP